MLPTTQMVRAPSDKQECDCFEEYLRESDWATFDSESVTTFHKVIVVVKLLIQLRFVKGSEKFYAYATGLALHKHMPMSVDVLLSHLQMLKRHIKNAQSLVGTGPATYPKDRATVQAMNPELL